MVLRRGPDTTCRDCKGAVDMTFHPDGSILSTSHNCNKQAPGPPDLPRIWKQGEWWRQGEGVAFKPDPRTRFERVDDSS